MVKWSNDIEDGFYTTDVGYWRIAKTTADCTASIWYDNGDVFPPLSLPIQGLTPQNFDARVDQVVKILRDNQGDKRADTPDSVTAQWRKLSSLVLV